MGWLHWVGGGVDMGWLHWVGGGVDMGWLHWDNCWSYGNHGNHWGSNDGAEGRALGWGGAGLVGPGVVGEPLGGDEVLAGGVGGVYITPLGPGTVHSQTVALHHAVGVSEGEAAALTAAVDQGRGRLLISRIQSLAAVSGEGAEEAE